MLKKNIFAILCALCIIQPANAQVGFIVRPNSSTLTNPVSGQTWWANSTNNTLNVYNGSAFQVASAPQNNFTAVVNPTTSNDNTQGYSPASLWYNTSNQNTYECVDASTLAAVWVQTNNLGGLTIPLTQLAQGGAAGGQSLIYNSGSGHWAPGAPKILLSQVLQSSALTGQVPVWNGSAWVAASLSGSGGAPATPTFITQNNEAASLPNSSQLVAGSNVTFTPGANSLTISASATGSLTVVPEVSDFSAVTGNLYLVTLGISDVVCHLPDATTNAGQTFSVVLNIGSSGASGLSFTTQSSQLINGTNTGTYFNAINGSNAVIVRNFYSDGANWAVTESSTTTAGLQLNAASGVQSGNFAQINGTGQAAQWQPLFYAIHENSDFGISNAQLSYFVDIRTNDVTATLPNATYFFGQTLIVLVSNDTATYHLYFDTSAGQTINNAVPASLTALATTGKSYIFISDGSNWFTAAGL